jgi:hypothetical protein
VMSVYHDSTQSLRVALDHLADRAGQEVWARELAHAVYPDDSEVDAESRLYGVLGAFGSRVINKYGKDSWFFRTWRGSPPDESRGHMIYTMPPKAAW